MTGFQSDFSLETAPSMAIGDLLKPSKILIPLLVFFSAMPGCNETPVSAPTGDQEAFHESNTKLNTAALDTKFDDFRAACEIYYQQKSRIHDLEMKMANKNASPEEIAQWNELVDLTKSERAELEQSIRTSSMSKDDRQVMVWILNTPPQHITAK